MTILTIVKTQQKRSKITINRSKIIKITFNIFVIHNFFKPYLCNNNIYDPDNYIADWGCIVHEIHIQFPRLDPPKNRSGRLTANQAMKQFISWVCYLVSTGLGRRELNARVADSSVARLETGLRGSLWIELMDGDTAVNRRRRREESPREYIYIRW